MRLQLNNEFGSLKKVVVCWGTAIPDYNHYQPNDPEFSKFHPYSWDSNLILKQQEQFFKLLEKYQVELLFPETKDHLIWQMFTRDAAFVIGDKFYYSNKRKFKERNGEVDELFRLLPLNKEQLKPITAEIEGGDVLVTGSDSCYVGQSSRTSSQAVSQLASQVATRTFELGQQVMHLDTRLTILPNSTALVELNQFSLADKQFLQDNYDIIAVTQAEAKRLGTNILLVNPETILVPTEHQRIANKLAKAGFKVETIDYSEPISLGGSFRCTTLPLVRE